MKNRDRLLNVLIKQGYTFTRLQETDSLLHKEFIQRVWPEKNKRSDPEILRWRHTPDKNTGEFNHIVCKKDGRIIGQVGIAPVKLNIGGVLHDAVWGFHFIVEPEYRDAGVGAGIEIYTAMVYRNILSDTPAPESKAYKKTMGFVLMEGPRIMMYPVKANYVLSLKLSKNLSTVVAPFLNIALKATRSLMLAGSDSSKWQPAGIDMIADRVAQYRRHIDIPHIIHDREFLNWRCNPPEALGTKSYLLKYTGDDISFCIYSISGEVLSVYEYYWDNTKAFRSLMKYLVKRHGREGLTTIRVLANTGAEEKRFRSIGFIPLRNKAFVMGYSPDGIFDHLTRMHVDGYDSV